MEIRRYWRIFRRRWLLIFIPSSIVLIAGLASYEPPPTTYNSGVRFIVGQLPASDTPLVDEQRYYNWLTSEYIVNGLTDWVKGGQFAVAVSMHLSDQGYDVAPPVIQGGLVADNARSMLTISLNHHDPQRLALIVDGVIAVLVNQNGQALPQLGGETAVLTQLDEPVVNQISPGIRGQLELPLRIALAVIAGVGLALLAEYLDPTIRDRYEAQQVGLDILGEIPKK